MFYSFNFKQLANAQSKLNIHHATYYDHIPPNTIKLCAAELSITVTEAINSVFKSNRFLYDILELNPGQKYLIFKTNNVMIKDNCGPILCQYYLKYLRQQELINFKG